MLNGRVVPYFSKTHHLGVVLIARTTGRIRIARMYAGGFNTLDFWIPPDQWCNQYPLGSLPTYRGKVTGTIYLQLVRIRRHLGKTKTAGVL